MSNLLSPLLFSSPFPSSSPVQLRTRSSLLEGLQAELSTRSQCMLGVPPLSSLQVSEGLRGVSEGSGGFIENFKVNVWIFFEAERTLVGPVNHQFCWISAIVAGSMFVMIHLPWLLDPWLCHCAFWHILTICSSCYMMIFMLYEVILFTVYCCCQFVESHQGSQSFIRYPWGTQKNWRSGDSKTQGVVILLFVTDRLSFCDIFVFYLYKKWADIWLLIFSGQNAYVSEKDVDR